MAEAPWFLVNYNNSPSQSKAILHLKLRLFVQMVALYARLFQKTFALRILRICNKKTPSRAQALWPWKERMPGLEFVSECQRIFWDSFSYLKQAKNKSFHLERTHQKCGFKYFASTWTWKLRSVFSYASCWMMFCLNIRIIFIENGKPTNQRPASSPRELQVSESELGVQVQAWSRTCQWTPCKVEAIICLNTRCRGRWPANKMDMIHVIFHVSFRYAKLQSHLLAVHFRISSDRKIFPHLPTPLPSSCVAWIQIIPWNPMKRTVWSFLQPTFWVWDLSPSSTFSMCKGSWRDRFCSTSTKSHDYMQSTWLTKSTLLSKSSVWLVMFDFSQPPSPAHLLNDFFLRQENIRT